MKRQLHAFTILGAALLATTALPRPAHADLGELKWATEGIFRTRTVYLSNLALLFGAEVTVKLPQ